MLLDNDKMVQLSDALSARVSSSLGCSKLFTLISWVLVTSYPVLSLMF